MNNTYRIELESPLIRPGIKITTDVSERYALPVLDKLMELVREFNGIKHGVPTNDTSSQQEPVQYKARRSKA